MKYKILDFIKLIILYLIFGIFVGIFVIIAIYERIRNIKL